MPDTSGRAYARQSDTKAGDTLVTDDGFTCMAPYTRHDVHADDEGGLYIGCGDGRHYLDGQLEEGDEYIGLYHERDFFVQPTPSPHRPA